MTRISPLRLSLTYVAKSRATIAAIIALTLVTSALALVAPAIFAASLAALQLGGSGAAADPGTAFDLNHLGGRILALWPFRLATDPAAAILLLGTAYFVQILATAGLQYYVQVLTVRVQSRTSNLLQLDVMRHLLTLSLRFFHRSRTGELVSRIVVDADNAGGNVGPAVQSIVQYSLQTLALGVYLLSTSVWLTAGAVAVVCLHLVLNRLLKKPIRQVSGSARHARGEVAAVVHELVGGIRAVKSFGAERLAFARVRDIANHYLEVRLHQGYIDSIADPARSVLDSLAIIGVLAIATVQVRAGHLTPQGLILYMVVARMVIQPVSQLASSYLRLNTTSVLLARVAELLEEAPHVVDGDVDKRTFEHRLELRNVSFAYDEQPVLKDLTFPIERGQTVAIVGRSGAGKSTLTDLILRFYDPRDGQILIDGVDIRRLKLEAYRSLFGVVSQESLLFHDTIRDNIRFGRQEITDAEVERAAALANADRFIAGFDQGYDTIVGDRGVRLSGGERQRIALARAIAHHPQILILDEATSSLDSESEREVQRAIDGILQHSTAIVIAHRLSTVVRADRIVFIENGRIVDIGPHHELLNRCPPYRTLCELQFLVPAPAHV